MEYPVIIGSQPCGTLTERVEGLYTVFHADCPMRKGLIRLWLHGEGRSACLGLLAPCEERLVLTRRLSRLAREGFPREITLVSDRPGPEAAPAAPEPENRRPLPRSADRQPPPEPEGWRALPDGSLLSSDGRHAIPAALPPSSPLSPHLRQIGGRSYLVFRL